MKLEELAHEDGGRAYEEKVLSEVESQTIQRLKNGISTIFPPKNTRFFIFDPAGNEIYTDKELEHIYHETHFEGTEPLESGEVDYAITNPFPLIKDVLH